MLFKFAVALVALALTMSAMEDESENDKAIREWLAPRPSELFTPRGCTCERCNAYHVDHNALGYHKVLTSGDFAHTWRKVVMPCGKFRNVKFDCKAAPEDSGLQQVSMYRAPCCGVTFDEDAQAACEKCGWDATFDGMCPVDARDKEIFNVLVYGESQRGKTKDGEDGGKETSFQTVPLNTPMNMTELYAAIGDQTGDYLAHYYTFNIEDLTAKIHDYTFGPNTIKISADFAAQIVHTFPDNVTCTKFNHSNCEVIVVALNPREVTDGDGKTKRVVTVHVWYGIGSTASKYKEADSHFHNAHLTRIIDYYKANLHLYVSTPGTTLEYVLVCTDGCARQFKGRYNFKYVAEYLKYLGVMVIHVFAATAHGKGFVDALGQKPGLLLKTAEQFSRRTETAYELFKLCQEKLAGDVEQVGKGHHAVDKYFVNYVTSDPNDSHKEDPQTIYVERRRTWDCDGIPGSSNIYLYTGADLCLRLRLETQAGNQVGTQTDTCQQTDTCHRRPAQGGRRPRLDEAVLLRLHAVPVICLHPLLPHRVDGPPQLAHPPVPRLPLRT